MPDRLTRVVVDPRFVLAEVDPRLFGSFVEHMERCVYTGIYEPSHPTADAAGFRGDVADLVRELDVPLVRYPGGNFVSGYRWEDGVGPREDRPRTLDLAWGAVEPNEVGTDEFLGWCRTVGTEPMLAVNLGTRGVDAAAALVEYCNAPTGTRWADLRRNNGFVEPHDVRVWCLGNEMDGPWQIGHKTADEYGRLAAATARAMRRVDPDVELVACGSSGPAMPTFGSWERTVLEHCYADIDYLALHCYVEETPGDTGSFLASGLELDAYIDGVVATVDHARAVGRHRSRVDLSFDEWNVWFASEDAEHPAEDREPAEATYDVADAVVVGGLLMSLLRHADRVRIACQAQLVNVLAPIRTTPGGPAWRQTIFHPYALTSRHGRGAVLRAAVNGPRYPTERYGEVPTVDAVPVWHDDGGELVAFLVNRDQEAAAPVEVALHGPLRPVSAAGVVLADDDPGAANSEREPERVRPRPLDGVVVDGRCVRVTLPPLSWGLVRVQARSAL